MVGAVWNSLMVGILALSSWLLVGENDLLGTPTTAIGALVAGFTAMTGLMVWIVKRLLDTTIPGMQTAFQTVMDRQQTGFQTAQDRQQVVYQTAQDNFSKLNQAAQAEYRKDLQTIIDSFAKECQAMRTLFETRTAQEREFFDKELNLIMSEVRTDRAAAITSISTNQAALLKILDAKLPANMPTNSQQSTGAPHV